MAIPSFLAMTAAEIMAGTPFPPRIAWMACHFSPYTTGLSNLPDILPSGSLLILNDRTPVCGHDPRAVEYQLRDCMEACCCAGLLLDFQRAGEPENAALAAHLVSALPGPVAVSESYAQGLGCPVFLSPLPCCKSVKDHLAPWAGREIWLEMALDATSVTVTEDGALIAPGQGTFPGGHREEALHCHYTMELAPRQAVFHIWRTREDLDCLLTEAGQFGVTRAVGLYQELKDSQI